MFDTLTYRQVTWPWTKAWLWLHGYRRTMYPISQDEEYMVVDGMPWVVVTNIQYEPRWVRR